MRSEPSQASRNQHASKPGKESAMDQHARFKALYPDCLLLFRIGDFYETFHDDAKTIAAALGLTLTKRKDGVPLAGVPHHQLENYLRRLVDQGFRVAVAEQMQDPKEAKGVVEREVTRVVTPGTVVDEALLDPEQVSTLAAVAFDAYSPGRAGLAMIESATGRFEVFEGSIEHCRDELARARPSELLFACADLDQRTPETVSSLTAGLSLALTPCPVWPFRDEEAHRCLLEQFGVATLEAFGLEDPGPARAAAGAAVRYLLETSPALNAQGRLRHLRPPRRGDATGVLDAVSLRALEVERTLRDDALQGSLLGVFLRPGHTGTSGSSPGGAGFCRTPMGKRLLRDWLCRPLSNAEAIRSRQGRVAVLVEDHRLADELSSALDAVRDVARIAGRLALGRATPRDLVALAQSVQAAQGVRELLSTTPAFASMHESLSESLNQLTDLAHEITSSCVDDPPGHLRQGGLFRGGIDAELDEARLLQRDAGAWLAEYQSRLSSQNDLPPIKVGFNKVFGYYIELTAAQTRDHADALERAGLTRQQTLKNAERFTTPELRDFEHRVTTAESRAIEREQSLFAALCQRASERTDPMTALAEGIAQLDATGALAAKARKHRWVRPEIVDEPVLEIEGGRHPVLDQSLGHKFVPNDVTLGAVREDESAHVALITGPNMAGKSTFIRQTALLALLAQVGSYLPADRAVVGVCDRICTRVGADDALHQGRSTFMVEMTETASILHQATSRSLVVLDEIGRGTSTLDGLSLAWAIAEELARPAGPRTLFATHYHELTDLGESLEGRLKNLHVAVREFTPEPTQADPHPATELVFVHRILPGRADQSYGVHVAELAGVPASVVRRAREVLSTLAVEQRGHTRQDIPAPADASTARPGPTGKPGANAQLSLFTEFVPHPALDRLREVKLDALTPLQAFDLLRELAASVDAHQH